MSTAIEFNNISKIYRLGLVSTGTLANDIHRWWTMNIRGKEDPYLTIGETNDRSTKGGSEYVWALKDIDFKVEQGDVVGIIGKNGAGKSTLLKILSKVTAPTTGTIRARGRIGSLLEVGTGFHPEMTGRENIYMNGAILGMTKAEITQKLDEIVDFSGCERYIDTPVKRYSSGMMVRLGFAVAAYLDPEILVVDEVLAVGDAEFQKKAIGKMQDVSRGEGRTVLFVSHNMASIRTLCHTGLLLENGHIRCNGSIDSVVDEYLAGFDFSKKYSEWEINYNKPISFKSICLFVIGKNEEQAIDITDEIHIRINYYVSENISNTNIALSLYCNSILLFNTWDIDDCSQLETLREKGLHETEIVLPNILLPGKYSIHLGTGIPNIGAFQSKTDCILFEIINTQIDDNRKSISRGGIVKTMVKWHDRIIHQ